MFKLDLSCFQKSFDQLPDPLKKYMTLEEARQVLAEAGQVEMDPVILQKAKTIAYAAQLFASDKEASEHFQCMRDNALFQRGWKDFIRENKENPSRTLIEGHVIRCISSTLRNLLYTDSKDLKKRSDPKRHPILRPLEEFDSNHYTKNILDIFKEAGIELEQHPALAEYVIGPKGYLFYHYNLRVSACEGPQKIRLESDQLDRFVQSDKFGITLNLESENLTARCLEEKIISLISTFCLSFPPDGPWLLKKWTKAKMIAD